ncbi:zonular occludens toxin domain-containing protein [Natronorubrum halophilum]|uniref:zonular occludens toxin domain-containing protein n=1 Tax=Natronorubrum halophilum TaxID=1702106 RepID=UPI000EF65E2C|nr:zonular occludens toxin domain-containing protein [Natronorubrum halophilum]
MSIEKTKSKDAVPPLVRDNPILRHKVWNKMHRHNDNWMAAVVGETGSGKSWASIRIAEAVDPDFSIDQVAFGVREFMELVTDDSLGRGSVIVFEEASVEASAHEWYSKSNQVLSNVLDTWRHQNRGAIFTLPAFGQLQKTARGRMSALVQMHEKNEDAGYTIAKYKRCQQNTDTGKIYKKYSTLNGKRYKYLTLRPPSEELRQAYEEKKSQYTRDLNEELLEELIAAEEEKKKDEDQDPKDIYNKITSEGAISEYISDNHGQQYIDRDLIELEYDIGDKQSRKVKALLKKDVDDNVM